MMIDDINSHEEEIISKMDSKRNQQRLEFDTYIAQNHAQRECGREGDRSK